MTNLINLLDFSKLSWFNTVFPLSPFLPFFSLNESIFCVLRLGASQNTSDDGGDRPIYRRFQDFDVAFVFVSSQKKDFIVFTRSICLLVIIGGKTLL